MTDILLGGVKKFRYLILVHPDHAVSGIKGDSGVAVNRVVNNDVPNYCTV